MDRLEAMALLVATVDHGSLTGAGRALRVTLPTLSRKLSELEAELGAQLLIRTTRKLALTDAGAAYVASARKILEAVDDAERAAAGEHSAPRGELVLSAPLAFGRLHFLPVVTEFLAAHAQISVRLRLSDRNLQLVDEHVDAALRIGTLPPSGLVASRLGAMRSVLCGSPRLFERVARPQRPEDLATLPCVGFEGPAPFAAWTFPQRGKRRAVAVPIRPRLAVSTAEAALDAAVRGVGVTRLLHYQASAALAAGELELLLPSYEPEPVPVHLVHPARGQLPLTLRTFIDFAVPRLREACQRVGQAGTKQRRAR